MGVVHRSNNRVLPSNARAADVAKDTLKAVMDVQVRRYDAAFRVSGYSGILYNRLKSGTKCACHNRSGAVSSMLGDDGRASPGLIDSLISGNEFGVREYGVVTATTNQAKATMLEIRPVNHAQTHVEVLDRSLEPPSLFELDNKSAVPRIPGSFLDVAGIDPEDPTITTLVDGGHSIKGNLINEESEEYLDLGTHDPGMMGHTDASCPVCFGTGYVGGFSVHRGFRRTLVPYEDAATLDGVLNLEEDHPTATATSCEWLVVLPFGAVGVDSLRLFQDDRVFPSPATFSVDGTVLTSESQILDFCDGLPHRVRVAFSSPSKFSHLEIQISQSTESANFELPRMSKSGDMSLLERVDPFQVTLSPLIPNVDTHDILVESTTGKRLLVKTINTWHSNQRSTLGWEVEVRPTQPQEIYSILPLRRKLERQNNLPIARDNSHGKLRT